MAGSVALFETERLRLESWQPSQLNDLVRLHGNPVISKYLSAAGLPWTEAACAARLQRWLGEFRDHRMGKLRVIRKSDEVFVGRAGYSLYEPTGEPEIGYALLPEFWGLGYATEAAAGLRDWIFRETDWDHFIGLADVGNTASLKVLRAIGMKETHVADFDGAPCQFHVYEKPR
jgi:ribosomal-protein-alanine N-acetyltransferase